MYLIITDRKFDVTDKWEMINRYFNEDYILGYDFDGIPTSQMVDLLERTSDNAVIITSDTRLLIVGKSKIGIDNIYIFYNCNIKRLTDCAI